MTTDERELLLSLARVLIDGAGYEERAKIDRLRAAVEKEGQAVPRAERRARLDDDIARAAVALALK